MQSEGRPTSTTKIIALPDRRRGEGLATLALRRFRRKKLAMAGLALILAFYLTGILAPLLAPYSYSAQNLDASFERPSAEHWLGTDRLGRDMLSRIIWGARTSVIVSAMSVITGTLFLGTALGVLAGYLGGKVDTLIMRVADIFLAFPEILLVILIAATLRPRMIGVIQNFEDATGFKGLVESGAADYFLIFGALSVFSWVGIARLIRGQILSLKEREYVLAARSLGASTRRIMFLHLFPNTINLLIVMVTAGLGGSIGAELTLSWLGIGIQPPTASLGVMIWENQSLSQLQTHPHVLLSVITLVTVVFFAFQIFGDGLNDALNPRAR
ncbi:MAG: ABC transporter permease [Dehalococcoidia bacterium]|nr:ABC transporter permease [Dehalococcoidia bacterium]